MTSPKNPVTDPSQYDCDCAYSNDLVDPNLWCVDVLKFVVFLQAYTVLKPLSSSDPLRVSYLETLFTGSGRAPETTLRLVILAVRTAVPKASAVLSTVVYELCRRGFEFRAGSFVL